MMGIQSFIIQPKFWLMSVFLIIQQLIVASSNFWIVALIRDIQTNSMIYVSLSLYLISLLLPYLPGSIAIIYQEKWKYSLILNLSESFKKTHNSNQKIWADKDSKETRIAMLSNEGINALTEFTEYVYNLLSTALNVLFNVTALAILITGEFGVSYLISLVLVACMMLLQQTKQEKLSVKAQNARISFLKTLLNSWDNIVLGNRYNFNLWEKRSLRASHSFVNRNLHIIRFRQWFSVLIAAFTFVPSFLVVIQMVVKNHSNPLVLSAIAVTLPRLFMILNFTYDLLKLAFYWPSQKKILERVEMMVGNNQEGSSFTHRIRWEKIRLLHSALGIGDMTESNINDLDGIIKKSMIPGRLTIRGENGSGKTTLLLAIKDALKESAFFLPVKHQLCFKNNVHYLSSGQGIKSALLEIKNFVNEKVILLDEWDANLDNQNKEEISHLIDEIACNRCVIEVRHRS